MFIVTVLEITTLAKLFNIFEGMRLAIIYTLAKISHKEYTLHVILFIYSKYYNKHSSKFVLLTEFVVFIAINCTILVP